LKIGKSKDRETYLINLDRQVPEKWGLGWDLNFQKNGK